MQQHDKKPVNKTHFGQLNPSLGWFAPIREFFHEVSQIIFGPSLTRVRYVKPADNVLFGNALKNPRNYPHMREALNKAKGIADELSPEKPHVVVVGGAYGLEAYTFAKLGCRVTMIDIGDYTKEVKSLNRRLVLLNRFLSKTAHKEPITFIHGDVTKINPKDFVKGYGAVDILCAFRVTHFFDIEQQFKFFKFIDICTKKVASAFILSKNGYKHDQSSPDFDADDLRWRKSFYYHQPNLSAQIHPYTEQEYGILFNSSGMIVTKKFDYYGQTFTAASRPASAIELPQTHETYG